MTYISVHSGTKYHKRRVPKQVLFVHRVLCTKMYGMYDWLFFVQILVISVRTGTFTPCTLFDLCTKRGTYGTHPFRGVPVYAVQCGFLYAGWKSWRF